MIVPLQKGARERLHRRLLLSESCARMLPGGVRQEAGAVEHRRDCDIEYCGETGKDHTGKGVLVLRKRYYSECDVDYRQKLMGEQR